MKTKFTKMHGIGNDFIVISGIDDDSLVEELSRLAPALTDRRFGIGADGVIVVAPGTEGDFRMHYVNADGSVSGTCGNGIRCVGKFVYDRGLWSEKTLKLETGDGVLDLELDVKDGEVASINVGMGVPDFSADSLPARFPGCSGTLIESPLRVGGEEFAVTCLSLGNPHCVHFIAEGASLSEFPVELLGRKIENLKDVFPERVNAEYVSVFSPVRIALRVWERGSGETLACGSGACAAVIAGVVTGRLEPSRRVSVHLPGGTLDVSWSGVEGDGVEMRGPAETVFEGEFDL